MTHRENYRNICSCVFELDAKYTSGCLPNSYLLPVLASFLHLVLASLLILGIGHYSMLYSEELNVVLLHISCCWKPPFWLWMFMRRWRWWCCSGTATPL